MNAAGNISVVAAWCAAVDFTGARREV